MASKDAASASNGSLDRQEFRKIFADTGKGTLNALLIVSGGATISFLSFLGNAVKEGGIANRIGDSATAGFIPAMQWFVASVSLCVLGHGTTYFSHGAYYFRYERTGAAFAIVTIVLELACVGAFVYGSFAAINAFTDAAKALAHG